MNPNIGDTCCVFFLELHTGMLSFCSMEFTISFCNSKILTLESVFKFKMVNY